ncbi:MAG: MFS transporter [Bacteroidales bacterium]|nr:MFS transporter [Bacteroidales bacterium]
MRDNLFSLHGMKTGEKYMVSMLLSQALFLGIFIGAFDISAHSLFLAIFDEKMLAKGYIASGLAGIILLSMYFFVQARNKSGNFGFLNLIAVAAITLVLWIILVNSSSKWIVFIIFIMLGPLNIISIMGFRTTAGSIFTSNKGKRLFAIVDASLITGIIIGCYSIPLLLSVGLKLSNILLLSAISVSASAVIQAIAGERPHSERENTDNQPNGFKSTVSLLNVFRNDSYSRVLGIFIVLSVISAFFIQYSFLAVTREKFPTGEEMARFLGIFTGSIMLLTLAGKFFIFSFLLKNYGLKTCLTISPVLLAIFTVLAVAFGIGMGYTQETASGFMIFFILLALIRFLSKSLDESIESSTFKVLYQTFDEKIRFGVQSIMDGAVKEAAAFLAGLILAGIGVLSFVDLLHFSWILIIVLLIWLYFAFRLYTEYRKSVRNGLESLKSENIPREEFKEPVIFRSRYYGERLFSLDYFNLISGDYTVFEKTDNRHYFNKIIYQTLLKQDINLMPAIKKLAGQKFDKEIRDQAADLMKNMESISSGLMQEEERIISAKRVLSETRMPQTTEILRLLRDKSIESKRLAIYMIGKFRLSDMIPEVCDCLNIPGLERDAVAVLKAFGSTAEEELIRFYMVSSGNINSSKTILRLLSKLPLDEGTGFLFSRLWSNSRQLKEVSLNSLLKSHFIPSAEDKERLNMLISDIVGIITWNLSARRCLEKNNDDILLNEINKELNRWSDFLINILSITYDAAAVTRIRKSLEFETIESVHYAHAIIDIVVDDSVKAKITYLLDVIPDDEKLRKLTRFFPVEIPDYNKLLEDILNRDYNLLSLWTKASVLRHMPVIMDSEMAESVVALLFSPESLLQEEAVRLICRSDLKLYKSVYSRIPLATRKHLDRIIDSDTDNRVLLFEKIRFLSDCFKGIIEEELILLAKSMILFSDIKELMSSLPDGYILWALKSGNGIPVAQLFYSSGREQLLAKSAGVEYASVYILSFRALEEFLYQFPDNSEIVLTYLEKSEIPEN